MPGHGLSPDEVEMLTHFTRELVGTFALLRDAWLAADETNAHAIENAIAILFVQSHSARRNTPLLRKVLMHGHDRDGELISKVSARALDLGAIEGRLRGIISTADELAGEERDRGRPIARLESIEAAAGVCLTIFQEASPTVLDLLPPTKPR